MSALEHLTIVDRDLTKEFYLAARALPWPADEPPPTADDLEAMEHLDLFGDCGRCGVAPAETFPEITAEQASAWNAANPQRIFKKGPRAAYTVPARSLCICDHEDITGYAWRAYGAWRERKPAQDTLRRAYEKCSDLLPAQVREQLRGLISARWIDRDAVLNALKITDEAAPAERAEEPPRATQSLAPRKWECIPEPDGSVRIGDGVDRGRKIPAHADSMLKLMRALIAAGPRGIKWDDVRRQQNHESGGRYRRGDQTFARIARRLRATYFPVGMQWRLEIDGLGAKLDTSDC